MLAKVSDETVCRLREFVILELRVTLVQKVFEKIMEIWGSVWSKFEEAIFTLLSENQKLELGVWRVEVGKTKNKLLF